MNITSTLPFTLLLILFSNQTLADKENDMWQQFKAQKGMKELDAEFAEPKPEPVIVERVIERVIEVQVPVVIVQPEPAPVVIVQPEPVITPELVPVSQPSVVTAELDGYMFKLGACQLAHRNIKCKLTINSAESDGELNLYATSGGQSSKLFDHNGNEYTVSTVIMGNKTHGNYVKNKYISGVTAKGTIEFTDVDTSTNSISMFDLSFYNHVTRKYRHVQFRDVILSL